MPDLWPEYLCLTCGQAERFLRTGWQIAHLYQVVDGWGEVHKEEQIEAVDWVHGTMTVECSDCGAAWHPSEGQAHLTWSTPEETTP